MKHTPGTRTLFGLAAVGLSLIAAAAVADSPPRWLDYLITGLYATIMALAAVLAWRHRELVKPPSVTWIAAGWAALLVVVTLTVASLSGSLDGTMLLALFLPIQPLALIMAGVWWWRRSAARRSTGS